MITSDCRSPDFSLVPDFYIFLSLLSVFPGMYVVSMCCKKKKKNLMNKLMKNCLCLKAQRWRFFFFNKNSCSLLCIYFTYLANTSHVRLHLILTQPYCYLYFTGEETVA